MSSPVVYFLVNLSFYDVLLVVFSLVIGIILGYNMRPAHSRAGSSKRRGSHPSKQKKELREKLPHKKKEKEEGTKKTDKDEKKKVSLDKLKIKKSGDNAPKRLLTRAEEKTPQKPKEEGKAQNKEAPLDKGSTKQGAKGEIPLGDEGQAAGQEEVTLPEALTPLDMGVDDNILEEAATNVEQKEEQGEEQKAEEVNAPKGMKYNNDLGWVYISPPEQIDNLTELSGLNVLMQKRISDMGVFTYWQVAEWTPEMHEKVAAELDMQSTILPGVWTSQALQILKDAGL